MKKLILAMIFMPVIALAQGAASSGGNGGDAVVCPDRIEMLDSIESAYEGFPVVFSPESKTIRLKVQELLARVAEKDLNLQEELETRTEKFLLDVEAFEQEGQPEKDYPSTRFRDGELSNISDEGAAFIPPGCEMQQLIVRTPRPFPNQKEYSARRDLWVGMSNDQKAVAIFHEAVYGYLVDYSVNSSPSARWYVGLSASDRLKGLSDVDLYQLMVKYKFPAKAWRREYQEFYFDPLIGVEYNSDGSIKSLMSAVIKKDSEFALIRGTEIMIKGKVCRVLFSGHQWQKIILFGKDCPGLRVSEGRRFILSTFKLVPEWREMLGGFTGGPSETVYRREVQPLKNETVMNLEKSVIERTSSGFRIYNIGIPHWKFNAEYIIPIVGQMSLLNGPVIWWQRWDIGVMYLDHQRIFQKVEFENRPWSKMISHLHKL